MANTLGLVLVLFFWVSDAFAWSREGHRWIASRAMANLTAEQQSYFQARLENGPWAGAEQHAPLLAAAASAWPDAVRDQSVVSIFRRYGSGGIPTPLRGWGETDSNDWHYANRTFLNSTAEQISSEQCRFDRSGRLFEVWPKLLQAYSDSSNHHDQGLVLAFLMHLLGDAYQPLHTVSAVSSGCRHDRGGNHFCVEPFSPVANKGCKTRLHKLWDDGFGQFSQNASGGPPLARFVGDSSSLTHIDERIQPWLTILYPKSSVDLLGSFAITGQTAVRQLASQAAAHLSALLVQLYQLDSQKIERP